MKLKNTLLFLAVFVVLLGVVIFMNRRQDNAEKAKEDAARVLVLEKNDVTEILLKPSGIHLVKEGDEWKITEPIQTAGDESSIESIINTFSWAKTERVVSEDSAEYSDFGIDPPLGQIEIVRGDRRDIIYVGEKNPIGNFIFARKNDDPQVFLTTTSFSSHIDKTIFDLRDKRALAFTKDNVRKIQLKNSAGNFELTRSGDEWELQSPIITEADKSTVDQILNQTDNARAREFITEKAENLTIFGLTVPTIQLHLFLGADEAKKTLDIGTMKDDKFYARDDSRTAVFLVDSSYVENLKVGLFDLRDKQIVQFTSTDVDSFILNFADQNIVCIKDTSDNWFVKEPESRKAKSWKVSSITNGITSMKVAEFVDDNPTDLTKYGLDTPAARVQLFSKSTMLGDVAFGNKKGDNVYIKLMTRNAIYLVNDDIYEKVTPALNDLAEEKEESEEDVK